MQDVIYISIYLNFERPAVQGVALSLVESNVYVLPIYVL